MDKNVIDLFCGAGGLSHGLRRAGYDVLAGVDSNEHCMETYSKNHPDTEAFREDLTEMDPEDITDAIETQDVFLVAGGPPCQGFSNANKQDSHERFIEDPRNNLYKEFVRFVDHIEPEYILMENVRGIKKVSDQIIEDFAKIGYKVDYIVINAENYGIPQNRTRVFFIGVKDKDSFWESKLRVEKIKARIKSKERDEKRVLKDIFWGLREVSPLPEKYMTNHESEEHGFTEDKLQNNDDDVPSYIYEINSGSIPNDIYNHKARFHNDRDREIFRRLPEGGKSDHPDIQDINPYKDRNDVFKDKYYKLPTDKVCKTITAHMKFDCNMYIHPLEDRGLTPREAARVQSFPDTYRFHGPYTRWFMQVGNAVPPLLGKYLGNSIIEVHKEEQKKQVVQ